MATGYTSTPYRYRNLQISNTTDEQRLSADDINNAPILKRNGSPPTGDGTAIPIIYGRQPAQGIQITDFIEDSGNLYVGVGWCLGIIDAIEKTFINDLPIPTGVEVRHYLGTPTQTADSWLSSLITDYNDSLVFTGPGGVPVGVAYSVFKIATSAITGVPRFSSIIRGKLVFDPEATNDGDPYENDNSFSFDFEAGGIDTSPNTQPLTLHGGAFIDSAGLNLNN